jgi:alpha-galactosidase
LVGVAALAGASILLAIAATGHLPSWSTSPNAVARTGEPTYLAPTGLPPYAVVPYGNDLALTPPMGWNGYNHFGLAVTADTVRAMARALVTSGLKSLGYTYVNVDGGWDLRKRASDGSLQPDPKKFPQGIKPVADYVHALGLKFGIYTSAGYKNCANTSAGSFGHYTQDADMFASWGVDYVKLDWCYMPVRNYPFMTHLAMSEMLAKKFGDALIASGRRMVLDINDWIDPSTSEWANDLGNAGRTAPDISDSYASMLFNFMRDMALYKNARPDHWNDPDMLEVGNGGMTLTEQRTEFSLWAELAAPLIAGNDLTQMSHDAFTILSNTRVIAVDQDSLGVQGYPVTNRGGHWVFTKPLENGGRAVVLFNQTSKPAVIRTTVGAIGLSGASTYTLQDLWTGQVLTTKSAISAFVPPHGVVMYLVGPQA